MYDTSYATWHWSFALPPTSFVSSDRLGPRCVERTFPLTLCHRQVGSSVKNRGGSGLYIVKRANFRFRVFRRMTPMLRFDACVCMFSLRIDRRGNGTLSTFCVQDEYAIALQEGKKPYHEGDRASEPLFTYVKPFVFEKPTFATFLKLLVRTRRRNWEQSIKVVVFFSTSSCGILQRPDGSANELWPFA